MVPGNVLYHDGHLMGRFTLKGAVGALSERWEVISAWGQMNNLGRKFAGGDLG